MSEVRLRNNVRITGAGEQTIMFAHGFGCDQNVWRYLIKEFESSYRLVVFDFVGSGQSDLTAYNSSRYGSLDGYALDVIEILEELNFRDVIFIGH